MERIVVTWTINSFECSHSCIECLEYSSVENFRKDFENKLLEYVIELERYKKEYQEWQENHSEIYVPMRHAPQKLSSRPDLVAKRDKKSIEIREKLLKSFKNRPKEPAEEQLIGGVRFNMKDFYPYEESEQCKNYLSPPEIRSLDEWFEDCSGISRKREKK